MAKPPANITLGVDAQPPPLQLMLLGLQYAFLLSVYLVIVVIVVHEAGASREEARSLVSMAMIASAFGTALQALPRGPVGSGFLAPPVFSAIYLGPSILAVKAGGLPALACMTVCAGLTEIVIARFLHRLRIIMQPAVSGLTICIIALELGIVGLQHALGVGETGSPLLTAHVAVSGLTFAVAVAFTVWGKGVWRLICSLLGLLSGVSLAVALGLFDSAAVAQISGAPWLAVPNPSYIAFRLDPSLMPAFIAAGFAAAIRVVGVVTTCQRANDAAWTRPDFGNIRRGILADGIGCSVGGLVGAPGMNIGPSLVGVSIATGVTSRSVAFAASTVLFGLAFMPKVADVFLQLPLAVAGALLVFTASIMLASGLQLMLSRPLDIRFTFVIGIGLLLPLTRLVSLGYFESLPGWLAIVTNSGLAVGLSAAIGLLLIFRIATGRHETILWQRSNDALGQLRAALESNRKTWALSGEVIARASENTEKAIEVLREGHLIRDPVAIEAFERDGSLEIELHYKGLPLYLQDLTTETADTTEETAVMAGLQNIGMQVFVDRSVTVVRGADITLRLTFDI